MATDGNRGTRFDNGRLDTFASIYERDIDLVLVMALRASPAVADLFARAVECQRAPVLTVCHSVSTIDGREADIEMRLGDASRPVVVQIENKLDAVFQPDQPEAYAERMLALRSDASIADARSVLFCPARYRETAAASAVSFDATVTYEEVRDRLLEDGAWGREAALVIEHAIRKHRRGGSHSPDDLPRTRFFANFAELAAGEGLPEVPPKARKAGAGFLWYPREATLTQPRGWTLANASHGAWLGAKLVHGHADIELTGLAPLVDVEALRSDLSEESVAFSANKTSVKLRTVVPPLAPDRTVLDQFNEVAEFISELVRLRDWWEKKGRAVVESHLR